MGENIDDIGWNQKKR